jgi:arylsulfatase A-like enzyme/Tfp pilus assembly protein PilF
MQVFRPLLWLVLLVPCGTDATPAPVSSSKLPNIVLITLDTTRADRMGFLGSKRGVTSNLDLLAKRGIVFSRAYSHVPLTPPSHATILTGTYPQFNHLTYMGEPLQKDLPYLPEILHKRGYRTAAFVASMILDPKNITAVGFERGFDVYDAGFHKTRKGEDRYHSVERRAGEVVNRALTWLRRPSREPFFLWVHCYDPHGPYDPPVPYDSRYKSDPYDGEIAYMDAALGKLFAGLKATSLYAQTAIVVTADHGEAFGEHGERHHGMFLYDETIHIPLVIKLPNERSAGKRLSNRVGLVDIAPTLLQMLGQKVPREMQGESFLSEITELSPVHFAVDRSAFAESVYPHRAFGWSVLRSWRTGKYLYVQAPEQELYDQSMDPEAKKNVSSDAKAVTDTLAAQLKVFYDRTGSKGESHANLSPEQAESLRALGYMPSSVSQGDTATERGPDPKEHIEIANLLTEALFEAQEERYAQAIPKLEQVLKQEPNTNLAYLELGRALARVQRQEKAVPLLEEAVRRMPENGLAHYELGRAYVETKNWTAAAPEFEAAVASTPKSAEMHFYLAVVYERTQKLPEAIQQFQQVLTYQSDHFRANLLLGRLLGMQGQATAALPYLKKAAILQPASVEAHTFLANIYFELGENEKMQQERAEVQRLKASGASSAPLE